MRAGHHPTLPRKLQVDFRRILDLSVWPSGGSDSDSLENATSTGRRQRDANGADGTAEPRGHPAAEALRRGGHAALGFGFSAGGLLFPYYIGVMYGLHDLGVITRASETLCKACTSCFTTARQPRWITRPFQYATLTQAGASLHGLLQSSWWCTVCAAETRIGGASAGSLAAACYHSGLSEKTVTDACLVLCDDCRRNGTRGRLRHVLKLFLEKCGPQCCTPRCIATPGDPAFDGARHPFTWPLIQFLHRAWQLVMRRLLPADIHERCSGKAYVAVTTVFPRPRGLLVSEFSSRDDLIAALLTSCHIPWCVVHLTLPATLSKAFTHVSCSA